MSYMGAHNKTRRVRGTARNHPCALCPKQAQEWALIHVAPAIETDSEGRTYSRDPEDYLPMCFRCHRLYDKAAITHCPQGHTYEGANLLMDSGKRKCRTCVYARNRARRLTPEQRARKSQYQRNRRAQGRTA